MLEPFFIICNYATYIVFGLIAILLPIFIFKEAKSCKELEESTKNLKLESQQLLDFSSYIEANSSKYNNPEQIDKKYRTEKALEIYGKFIEENPDNLLALETRAETLKENGEYEKALEDYKTLLTKNPKNFEYILGQAITYALMGDFRTGINLINNFYKYKKQDDKYHVAMGDILFAIKKHDLALDYYTKAIELNPTNSTNYLARAEAYKKLKEMKKYHEDMQKCNELRDNLLKYAKEDSEETIQNIETKKPNKLFIAGGIIYIIIAIAIIYFHPTEEVMYCNTNLVCKIERTYFEGFKINKKITLTPNSDLSCKIAPYSKGKHKDYYGLYLKFDGKYPFVFYADNAFGDSYEEQYSELMGYCENHYKNFINYINNQGEYTYQVKSRADKGSFYFALTMLILAPILLFIKLGGK